MLRHPTTTSPIAATTLPALLAAGALLLVTTRALAHEDPPDCFQTGPAIVTSVFRADGTTALVGAASECETIQYRATLAKAIDSPEICAFSGGTFTLTTPDGVVHVLESDVPCIGGTIAPCDPNVDAVQSALVPYTVRKEDVLAGFILAVADYAGGIAHDRPANTAGVSATSPKASEVAPCDDGDACTENVCDPNGIGAAACTNPPVDCNDRNACTNDACSEGACTHVAPDPTCVPCETAADCGDDNVCTTETCIDGICGHVPVPGCTPCQIDEDCDDGNACTTDVCGEDDSCQLTTIPGCRPCTIDADCEDGDACTADACPAGACVQTPIAGCPAEICDDRIDNDGDGAIDCADTDCEGSAACPPELCGNCLDDDGDGDVDYEDSDCCEDSPNLDLRRMAVRTKPGGGKNRLRVKARYASQAPAGFDPSAGTTLQLRDDDGLFFCQSIPFKSDPARTRRGVFKFKDRSGALAAGLRKARFKVHKKGTGHVSFRTNGKKMPFRDPAGNDVEVTLRVGSQCTHATAALETKRARKGQRLVFP